MVDDLETRFSSLGFSDEAYHHQSEGIAACIHALHFPFTTKISQLSQIYEQR